jgi:para-aminobenzoate synthetase component 1
MLYCWGGGGITASSLWEAEYQETLDKIGPIMRGLEAPH